MHNAPYETAFDDSSRVLTVSGEVEEPAAASLRDTVEARSDQFSHDLVIDLSGVTYLPSVAIGVLATLRRRFLDSGTSLDLVAAEGSIAQRVLTVCALPHRTS